MKGRWIILTMLAERDELGDKRPTSGMGGMGGGLGREKSVQALKTAQRGKRVVVVDDDHGIRSMLQNLLRLKGFDVSASFSDGAELVALIDEINPRPDTILLDERMPRMSGVDACKVIHERYPSISIIFVSADDSARERAKQAGAVAFLKKPVSAADLISLINSG